MVLERDAATLTNSGFIFLLTFRISVRGSLHGVVLRENGEVFSAGDYTLDAQLNWTQAVWLEPKCNWESIHLAVARILSLCKHLSTYRWVLCKVWWPRIHWEMPQITLVSWNTMWCMLQWTNSYFYCPLYNPVQKLHFWSGYLHS